MSMEPLEQTLIDALTWALGCDTGMSSRALLLSAINGKPPAPGNHPSDNGDVGRCVRMLLALPWAYPRDFTGWTLEWRMAWSKIVKRWENGEVTP